MENRFYLLGLNPRFNQGRPGSTYPPPVRRRLVRTRSRCRRPSLANDVETRTMLSKRQAQRQITITAEDDTSRVWDAGRSIDRTRYNPATRTLSGSNDKSKVVGHGAERLPTANAQRLYHPFLQGPNVQQELMCTIAQEEPFWVEGREQGAVWHHAVAGCYSNGRRNTKSLPSFLSDAHPRSPIQVPQEAESPSQY
ncbi:hypothetical protein F5148DRAFT_508258 [Russula earlei]|uniref:Uncharacterized protein n=1 Tax=Russula earlei TaxID=71964 RepID=A0ACC0UGV8_9AGAM|nr:hypothetical protein F5148DRAFT_508258 [Russula earlei]